MEVPKKSFQYRFTHPIKQILGHSVIELMRQHLYGTTSAHVIYQLHAEERCEKTEWEEIQIESDLAKPHRRRVYEIDTDSDDETKFEMHDLNDQIKKGTG